MPSRRTPKFIVSIVGTLVALVVSLVSAWAVNINSQVQQNRERTHQLESQLPLMDYKLDLLLKNHGIEIPKETK